MRDDFNRLVVDANIMASALLGSSFVLLLQLFENGVMLMAPVHQIAETWIVVARESGQSPEWTDTQMQRLLTVVRPLGPALFNRYEHSARLRLHARGQPDWPVIAAAMATDADVWSHDKDFVGSGAPVWSTRVLRRQVETLDA